MRFSCGTYLTWLVCLLFSAGIIAGSSANVLCMGDNGHVKVEALCEPCCSGPGAGCGSTESESTQDHHNGCGNCTDLPLFQDPPSQRPLKSLAADTAPASEPLIDPALPRTKLSSRTVLFAEAGEVPSNKGRDLLSTTVLLC